MLNSVSHWLLIVIDVSVKSLLLAIVAFALLRLLKIRSSSVRHRVWAGVLCGMLMLPVLSRVLPPLPLPFDLDVAWLEKFASPDDTQPAVAEESVAESTVAMNSAIDSAVASATPMDAAQSNEANAPPWEEFAPEQYGHMPPEPFHADKLRASQGHSAAAINNASTDIALNDTDVSGTPVEPKPAIPWYVPVLQWLPTVVVGIWLSGTIVLLIRLLLGLLATAAIVRRSSPLNDSSQVHRSEKTHRRSGANGVSEDRSGVRQELRPTREDAADCLDDFRYPKARAVVRESSEVRVPVTVGLLKPTVLLPKEWRDWSGEKLEAVMTHETTHVERRDFLFAVLAEFNRCLYWFNPLSWWLRSRLSDLAEEACDDAAIDHTGDPTGYARHLLEVAAAVTKNSGRVCQPGLSMARQSNVEGRIHTILDLKRPLSERLSWRATIGIMVVMLPVIAVAAALRPGSPTSDESVPQQHATVSDHNDQTADSNSKKESAQQKATAAEVDSSDTSNPAIRLASENQPAENSSDDSTTAVEPEHQQEESDSAAAEDLTITGRVTVERGSPQMIEVSVRRVVRAQAYAAPRTSTWIGSALTTPGQDFTLTIPARQLPRELNNREWLSVQATVKPDGDEKPAALGIAAATIRDLADAKDIKLHMRTGQPITGRILDLEGQPVAGARLRILNVTSNESQSLTTWLKSLPKKGPQNDHMMMNMVSMFDDSDKSEESRLNSTNHELPVDIFEPAVTNATGEFGFQGIGKDQLLEVEVSGPRIAKTKLMIVARKLEKPANALGIFLGNTPLQGSSLQYVAPPSAPVTGIVRDKDSQEPIADLAIVVEGIAGSPMSQTGWIATTTDENGRYTINGLPTAADVKRYPNRISVTAKDQPYISTDFALPSSPGTEPIEFDMELKQAVLATGRLTDKATGKPVQASLHYTPFSGNPANPDYKRYGDETRYSLGHDRKYVTDAEGRFQIPVIPGRGVIGVICNDNTYRRAVGIQDIPEFADLLKPEQQRRGLDYTTNDFLAPLGMHIVKAIDVPADAKTLGVDLQADHGDSVTLHLAAVNPDGSLVKSKLWVSGARARHGASVSTKTFQADVTGLDPGESRRVYVSDQERTIGAVVEVTAKTKDLKVVVPPRATVKGQLVGVKGNPLKQRNVTAVVPDTSFFEVVRPTKTDDEGNFELKVPVGGPFNIMTERKPGPGSSRPIAVKTGLSVVPDLDSNSLETTINIGVLRLPGGKPMNKATLK